LDHRKIGHYIPGDFNDWTFIYLPYCDGGSFSGLKINPIEAYNTSLHFRGASNLAFALNDAIAHYNLTNVNQLVVTGGSAGGLSTILHVDRIAKMFNANVVGGLPQAGYFMYVNLIYFCFRVHLSKSFYAMTLHYDILFFPL
jgi:Pectinacetylesterase